MCAFSELQVSIYQYMDDLWEKGELSRILEKELTDKTSQLLCHLEKCKSIDSTRQRPCLECEITVSRLREIMQLLLFL